MTTKYEVLVIENSPAYSGPPLAMWTEIYATYDEAMAYAKKTIANDPLSYNRDVVTVLVIAHNFAENMPWPLERTPLMEVTP